MSVVISDSLAGASELPQPAALLGAWAGSAAFVYCRDLEGRILAANDAFSRKFGLAVNGIRGMPIVDLVHPEDASAPAAAIRQAGGGRATREQRWLTPQGWRWIGWEEGTLTDSAGQPQAIRAVGHDITRQRLAEEQYLRLSNAVEQCPVAIAITDPDGRVQYANAKYTETTGHTLETLLEGDIDMLREGHTDEQSYAQLRAAVAAGREWRGEISRLARDGNRLWEFVQVSCLRAAGGEISNLLWLREDVTGRKRLEDQLRQAQKMESLGTLAGGIAHDFNNILAVISGYAELFLLHPQDPDARTKSMNEIKRAVQRATGLVRQILTFSRKAEVRFAPVDLNQHLRDLVALLSETFPRNIAFHLALEDRLPPLLADQNQLQQIVLNLCVNARDAMPEGGTITLATSRRPGLQGNACACLEATDTGVGMTAEVKARIFEPFFTTKGGNRGTGLGLAVVYGIVASHEGSIEVDSTPGHGSTFRILLPLAETLTAAPDRNRRGEFPGGTESLLIVDDEPALRNLLQAALTRKGYKIATANDGLEAIALLRAGVKKFEAMVLDLNMPGATGLEVMRTVKATQPSLKVLVVTGHLTPEVRKEFERLGRSGFVRKPYTLDEVGRTLRALLDSRG